MQILRISMYCYFVDVEACYLVFPRDIVDFQVESVKKYVSVYFIYFWLTVTNNKKQECSCAETQVLLYKK